MRAINLHVSTERIRNSQSLRPKTGDKKVVAGVRGYVSNIQHQVSQLKQELRFNPTGNEHPASNPRPFIIPVFIPHAGCPHQCVFCNQVSIAGAKQRTLTPADLRLQIRKFINYRKENRKPVQIAFYGGNFLGLKSEEIRSLLDTAAEFVIDGQVDGIRFSTRPDTIGKRSMDILKDYPVSTVELGVQSMDDRILAQAGRGHSALDTIRAVDRLKERHFNIGLQMMVGLPGDDGTGTLTTAQKITELSPDFVRIYPTLVVANSRLADWYKSGDYAPMSLEESVNLVKKLYLKFKKAGINVIRMGLQATEDLADGTIVLAGPRHPAFGHMVHSEIFLDMAISAIESAHFLKETLTIYVNPRSIPKMRGLNNSNIRRLQSCFQLRSLAVRPDVSIAEDSLRIL